MRKMTQIVYSCLAIVGTIEASSASMKERPHANLPLVTIEAALEHDRLHVSDVRWANADSLIADFTAAGEDKSHIRLLSLDGTVGSALGEGELSAVAPDGVALLQRTKEGWILQERGAARRRIIFKEFKNGEIDLSNSTWRSPEWSWDGRYAAIAQRQVLRRDKDPSATIEVDGVSIVDFDRQASPPIEWVTRISIIDRGEASAVQQFKVPGSALQLAWDADDSLYVGQVQFNEIEPSTRLLRFNIHDDRPQQVYQTPGRFQSMQPAIHPDGEIIALAIDADNRKWDDFVSLVLIKSKTGQEVNRVTHDVPISGDDYCWSKDGSEIYARVRHGGLDEIWAIPLDGDPRPLAQGLRRHFDLALSPDGRKLSYKTEDGYGREDIRVLDLDSGKESIVLIVDEPARQLLLGQWRHIQWKSTDGVKPYGFLITPPGFDSHRQYPVLVYVHGGGPGSRLYLAAPFTRGVAEGPLEWHAWAALGYVVFIPDYRSTGDYGPAVIAARYRKGKLPIVDDAKDIMTGVGHVMNQGFVDPTRVAIMGHSAGGGRVYYLLTRHSETFAAAIINEGTFPDPVSYVIGLTSGRSAGSFPVGAFRSVFGADLAESPHRYKANYMFDAWRTKSPTLILMGNEKLGGVRHMPYEVLYSILKAHQIPTRMLSFVEEGHNYKNPAAARLAFEEARQWLETHMSKAEVASQPPW